MASRGNKHKRIYAVYKSELIFFKGTARQVADYMGVTVRTVHGYATTSCHRKIDAIKEHNNFYTRVKAIGWDDDDKNNI